MKKIVSIVIGVCFLSLVGCSNVPAGYKGVRVYLYGSTRGIDSEPLGVGRYLTGFNSEIYLFPTFLQNYTWTQGQEAGSKNDESITMQTAEGLTINSDVGITYSIQDNNVVKVFQKYRLGIDEITNTFLRNMVRDAMNQVASTMTVEQLYGNQKNAFISSVNKKVVAEAYADGITIDKVYLIGTFRLPQTVIDSINSKIQASQNAMKVENEVATTKAEAQKTLIVVNMRAQQTVIQAQAQAKQVEMEAIARAHANKILAESITPEFIQYQTIQRWDGKLPQVSSNAIPFMNLSGIKQQ